MNDRSKKEELIICDKEFPVVADISTGREMRLSPIVERSYDSYNSFRIPHLLSPEHKHMMKELPY